MKDFFFQIHIIIVAKEVVCKLAFAYVLMMIVSRFAWDEKIKRQQRYSFVILFGNDGIHRMPMSFANCNICKKNTTLNDEI